MHKRILLVHSLTILAGFCNAQDSSRVYFTTAAGLFAPLSAFSKAYENSLALSSGIEYRLGRYYCIQFMLDFNAVRYNQQVKDASSPYLFQHTSSPVFLAGLQLARNIFIGRPGKFFVAPFVGVGYANIGEPRLTLTNSGIIEQEVKRTTGIYAKQGARIGYRTASKILQTIYIETAYWRADIHVQNSRPAAFSFLAGTRFGF